MKPTIEPSTGPSVWRGPEMAARSDWITVLDDADVAELRAALAEVVRRGIGIPALKREDFPIPRVARKLEAIRRQLEDGTGFALIRGLPVAMFSKLESALVFWGMGSHLGPAFAQNAQGDMLGHVRDLGASTSDTKARGYQTRARLPFHNDSTDVVGLLCLNQSKSGGESRIVSSGAVHNAMLEQRPDLCEAMYGPFCVDRRGEESPGQKPYYTTTFFCRHEGRLFVKYNRGYVESAQRFADVPRLTDTQRAALDMMDALCNDPAFHLDMKFEPGDIQFVCNHSVLHSRATYEDWPEPERKRHLLRLWLRTPGFASPPESYAERNADMLAWQKAPRAPVFDASEIAAELAH
jgi:hypothetical protein